MIIKGNLNIVNRNDDELFIFFEKSVKENYSMLRTYYTTMGLDQANAEDLVQETFLAAFRMLDRFDRSKPLRPWLRGIAKNKYLEFCRTKREIPLGDEMLELIDAQYHYWENAHVSDRSLHDSLDDCIGKLDTEAAKTIELFYYRKLSTREIADTCGLNETTVRKRLERVRENLKGCMESKQI